MNHLITGCAGFIGFHLAERLLKEGMSVYGLDNLNQYYDTGLKKARLAVLMKYNGFRFSEADMCKQQELKNVFDEYSPEVVINLAAQPGVRYSITNPDVSMMNNVMAFFNLLECCKDSSVNHLLYASSSSVYGNSAKIPFSVDDNVDHPVSLYAATKKSNELMAYTYHHLYKFNVTGLRFFTVYGPWGRPDMAYYKFTEKIFNGQPIEVYNGGDMMRDFTYIDDVVESMHRLLTSVKPGGYRLLNIGGEHPVNLLEFIETLESKVGLKCDKIFLPMQPGDVKITCADSRELAELTGYVPQTRIDEGLAKFVKWYKEYYKIQ